MGKMWEKYFLLWEKADSDKAQKMQCAVQLGTTRQELFLMFLVGNGPVVFEL